MRWWPVVALVLAACDESGGGSELPDAGEPGPTPPTWHGEVQALVVENCVSCHREGGAAPFRLDTPELAVAMAPAALASIQSGRMPPWQPDPECREFRDQRLLTPEQKATFAEWVNAGTPLGTPGAEAVEQPQVADFEADLVTAPTEAYVANAEQPDDYRCFALDADFPEDTFLAGATVKPGDPAVVHHVLVYLVPPERVADLEALDAGEPGPGYTCFGGSGLGNNGPLVGWVPGMVPNLYAEGIARFIPAGSRMVMQVHYNTLAAEPAPDLTSVLFKVWDEPQPYIIDTRPQPFLGLGIAAGDAESVQVKEFKNRSDETLEILGVAPHAHLLAKSIRLDLIRADGESECVIDIPRWDFNWQQSYEFREGETVRLAPGDRFRLTCVYDNSPANQPVFNGEQLEPRDVVWGEGTLDEMCLNFITVVKPFEPRTTGVFPSCRAACADPQAFSCVADCLGATPDIGECVIPQLFGGAGCANECIPQAVSARTCLTECLTESLGAAGGIAACMTEVCPAIYTPLAACMDAALADGGCEEALGACAEG